MPWTDSFHSEGSGMKGLGAKELKEGVIDRGLCIGCGACIGICPYFETHKGRTANLFPCATNRKRS